MLEQDFLPDTISSDVHLMSVDGPAFDILVTMSKFLCLGMPLMDVIRASTTRPAEAIQRQICLAGGQPERGCSVL